MSEETEKKKSRRAARRETQQQAGSAAGQDETSGERRSKKRAGPSVGRERTAPEATSSIRDERLRAREVAAARRRKKRDEERSQAAAEGLDTSELVDDALARGAQATTRFVQRHFQWLQWVIIGGLVLGFGWLIYDYRTELGNQKATKRLMQGLQAEFGEVESDDELEVPASGFMDVRPEFASNAERLKAAATGYRQAMQDDPKPERRVLAELGLAGVLFDQGKYKEAEQAYRNVRESPLASRDPQVKGRALEGIGLSLEGMGKREEAAKTFKELVNQGSSFAELGRYHQARLLYEQGKRDEAKELLVKLLDKADPDPGSFGSPGFVKLAARQLLEAIDPKAAKPDAAAGLSPEQLKKIQELQKAAGSGQIDVEELMKALGKPQPGVPAAPTNPPETSQTPPEPNQPKVPAPATPTPPKPVPAAPLAPKPAQAPTGAAPQVPAPTPPKPAPEAPARAPAPTEPAPAGEGEGEGP